MTIRDKISIYCETYETKSVGNWNSLINVTKHSAHICRLALKWLNTVSC